MKKLVFFCLLIALFSCKKEDLPPESTPELAEIEYQALSDLAPLKIGEVSQYTNFEEVGDRINFNDITLIRKSTPLYGSGNIMLVLYMDHLFILYKSDCSIATMKFNYTITSIRIDNKNDILYTKGVRDNGTEVFLKNNLSAGFEYVYKY